MDAEKCNRYYPLGCAKLEDTGKETKISNLSDSGIDGVGIDISEIGKLTEWDWDLKFKPFEIGRDNSFNITYFGVDEYKREKVLMQQSTYYDPDDNRMKIAFNSKLLSDKVVLIAENKGKVVFQGEYLTPRNNACINFWPLVAIAAIYIIEHIDYHHTTETGPNGTTVTDETTWDPIKSTSFITPDGIEFEADKLRLRFTNNYPKGSEKSIPKMAQVQITATNYNDIIITDEKTCC